MTDIKNWMPRRPDFDDKDNYLRGIYFGTDSIITKNFFDKWYAKEIEPLFKDAKVYYSSSLDNVLGLTPQRFPEDTHEFLVLCRPIEKPKTKADWLDEIIKTAEGGNPRDISKALDMILEAREAIKGKDEKRGEK